MAEELQSELGDILPQFKNKEGQVVFPTMKDLMPPEVEHTDSAPGIEVKWNAPQAWSTPARVAVGAAGAAGAAVLNQPDLNPFGIPKGAKFQSSTDYGRGVAERTPPGQPESVVYRQSSTGKPLSQMELSTPAGQKTEALRREMKDLLGQWSGSTGRHNIDLDILRTSAGQAAYETRLKASAERRTLEDAAARASGGIDPALSAEEVARQRAVQLGAVRAPAAPLTHIYGQAPGSPDMVGQVTHTIPGEGGTASSAAREIGQHELAHFRSLLQTDQAAAMNYLNQLGLTGEDYKNFMLKAGQHLPTATGNVLVSQPDLLRLSGDTSGTRMTPEVQAQQARIDAAARAAAQAELQRTGNAERARMEYERAKAAATRAITGAEVAGEKLAGHSYLDLMTPEQKASLQFAGSRGKESSDLAEDIWKKQRDMIAARNEIPSKAGMIAGALPKIAKTGAKILSGAQALEMAEEAFARSQRGDPIGATIAGIGGIGAGAGALPGVGWVGATVPAITAEVALQLYDKYGEQAMPWLHKMGMPKDWNPANYSVMNKQ